MPSNKPQIDVKSKTIKGLEVFRAGNYGSKGTYTVDDLDEMIANASASLPDAAANFDHNHKGPAFGKLSNIYRVGDSLFADMERVPDEVFKGINNGTILSRSIELDLKFADEKAKKPGGKAVIGLAFLGASPPQVRHLSPFFSDEQIEHMAVTPPIYFSAEEFAMPTQKKEDEKDVKPEMEKDVKKDGKPEMESGLKEEDTDSNGYKSEMAAMKKRMMALESALKEEKESKEEMAQSIRKRDLELFNERRDRTVEEFCAKATSEGFLPPATVDALKPALTAHFEAHSRQVVEFAQGDKSGDAPQSIFDTFFENATPMALFNEGPGNHERETFADHERKTTGFSGSLSEEQHQQVFNRADELKAADKNGIGKSISHYVNMAMDELKSKNSR